MFRHFSGWETREKMIKDFEVDPALVPPDDAILFAIYGSGCYDGDAIVIYREGDKLFEVRGSHCSCYGLEGQWQPEEVSVAQLKMRPSFDKWFDYGEGAQEAWDKLIVSLT